MLTGATSEPTAAERGRVNAMPRETIPSQDRRSGGSTRSAATGAEGQADLAAVAPRTVRSARGVHPLGSFPPSPSFRSSARSPSATGISPLRRLPSSYS